ncbi:SRPBCC family protein [Methylobacterium organophilum]|uniref:SRPBCC family protein n=1 Tax=Methylobacterium organophilum TaxID=410 RepID=UPI001F1373F3|nr:SRPBCC family protein [Methylobacterium organophilum]UMY17213.1 SRPBCC family protein [Methylobacterium organophilum]
MKITQSFEVPRPLPAVWDLFQDIPAVALCMPGAELTEDKGNGVYAGKVGIKLGPFGASFDGEATVTTDPATHSGHAEGRGTDKRGGSRSKLALDYRLTDLGGSATRVDIDADVQLAGPIAQFGRTGLVNETASVLIGQFVKNVEAQLAALPAASDAAVASSPQPAAAAPPTQTTQISVLALLVRLIASLFRKRQKESTHG